MTDAERIADLERRVAGLEEFARQVKANALAEWMEANYRTLVGCIASGTPIRLPLTGVVITAEELRAAAAEVAGG